MGEDQGYQKELFEFREPKKRFPQFSGFFPKNFAGISLSAEKLIFVVIGLVMAAVLVYALGVERGKAIARRSPTAAARPVAVRNVPAYSPTPLPATAPPRTASAAAIRPGPEKAPVPPPKLTLPLTPSGINKPYTIVAASFSNRENALAAVDALRKRGLEAFMVKSGVYFQVCVGTYPDKTSAPSQNALAKIKSEYKGAFFKLR